MDRSLDCVTLRTQSVAAGIFFVVVGFLPFLGCGEVLHSAGDAAGAGPAPSSADGAPDAVPIFDPAGAPDARAPNPGCPQIVLPNEITGDGGDRCPGVTYTTSPSGAACDPSRIRFAHGRSCLGPAVGTFCDTVTFTAFGLASEPDGFRCSHELGVASCSLAANVCRTLDESALEAACAVTRALPKVEVRCVVYE